MENELKSLRFMEPTKYSWFTSSSGSGLALRIKAVLVGIIPILIIVFKAIGVEVAASSLAELIETLTFMIAAVMFIYGWIRHAFFKKNNLGRYIK